MNISGEGQLLPTKKHHQATNSESIKGKNGKSMQIAKMNLIYVASCEVLVHFDFSSPIN